MSQTVLVQCPHCRAEGNLADPTLFGKAISCPVCQQIFTAPVPTASEPPVAVTPAAIEPIAVPGNDTSVAVAVSASIVEAIPTPSAAEPLAIASPAEVSASCDVTSPVTAVQPIPGEAPAVDNQVVAAVAVAAISEPVAVIPPEPSAIAEPLAVPVVAETAVSTPPAAIDSATPVELVQAVQIAPTPPAAQGVPVAATPVGMPAMPVSSAPFTAEVPTAVGSVISAPVPPAVVPAAPVAVAPAPSGPVTFPGQAAAFPTEIALPQEGVFVPPPVEHTFDGPLPAFLAPQAAPGAEETRFAESLPEPVARGSVKPPKVPSKSMQTVIISTITVILLFATVMFLMGDPSRKFGKKPKSKEPEEDNPIARPMDSGPADQSIEDVFARINAASGSGDKKNDSNGSKEKK